MTQEYGAGKPDKGKYFSEALASMTADVAYAGAVRHLHDLGMKPKEIQENVMYPLSIERIEQVIREYEDKKASPEPEYEYVQRADRCGRKSFIRVKKTKHNSNQAFL